MDYIDLSSDDDEDLANTDNVKMEPVRRIRFNGNCVLDDIPMLYNDYGAPLKLNDEVINFYLQHRLPMMRQECNSSGNVAYFDTFFYTRLKKYESRLAESSTTNLQKLYKEIHKNGERRPLDNELLVIPCHYNVHWFLLVVLQPKGMIIGQADKFLTTTDSNRNCRVMFMDSLVNDKKNIAVIKRIHNSVGQLVINWLRMIFKANGYECLHSRAEILVCNRVPQQRNAVDCGLFLLAYAEWFTVYDTNWISKPKTVEWLEKMRIPSKGEACLVSGQARKHLLRMFEDLFV